MLDIDLIIKCTIDLLLCSLLTTSSITRSCSPPPPHLLHVYTGGNFTSDHTFTWTQVLLLTNPLSGFSLNDDNGWEGNYERVKNLRNTLPSLSTYDRTGGGGGFGLQVYCVSPTLQEVEIASMGGGGGGGYDGISIGGGGGGGIQVTR